MKITFALSLIFSITCLFGQEIYFSNSIGKMQVKLKPNAFLQDRQGFIWIGTDYGLLRLDGTNQRKFKHTKDDSTSLISNNVTSLSEDSQGNILVGTNDGLCVFNPLLEKFRKIELGDRHRIIYKTICDHKKNIWIASSYGLIQLDSKYIVKKRLTSEKNQKNNLSGNAVWTVIEDSKRNIWAGTNNGFTYFKNNDEYKLQAVYGPNARTGFNADSVFSMVENDDNSYWLGTYDGIFEIVLNDSLEYTHVYKGEGTTNSFYNHIFFTMVKSADGSIWAGSYRGGLNHFIRTPNGLKHKLYRSNAEDGNSISINEITALMVDQSNQLWIGTAVGVDRASPHLKKFKTLSTRDNINSLSHNLIKSIHFDTYDNLWVGTYDGLNFASSENLKKDSFLFKRIQYQKGKENWLRNDNINGINEDSQGQLWVSCMFGLHFFTIKDFLVNEKINCFTHRNGIPHTMNFNSSEQAKDEYYVAGYNNVSLLNLKKNNWEDSNWKVFNRSTNKGLKAYTIYDLLKIDSTTTVLGTNKGIHFMYNKNDSIYFNANIEMPDSLKVYDSSFNCFFKDSDDTFFVGTNYGLNKLTVGKDGIPVNSVLVEGNGFSGIAIKSIEKDVNNKFWLGSISGLYHVDIIDNKLHVIQKYTIADGLPSPNFIERSSAQDKKGHLYFGTDNGIVIVDPLNLQHNNFKPKIQFTELTIFNDFQKPNNESNSVLKKAINYTNRITLNYKQKIFSVGFSAMDFTNSTLNQYKYKISSIGDEWINLGHQNNLVITDLKPGNHTLTIMGTNSDGCWSDNLATLDIIIKPPFWKSWLAYLIYFLVFSGLLYTYLKIRINRRLAQVIQDAKVQEARLEERELLRQKNAEDFHDELGHRLSKISLFLELAERSTMKNSNTFKYLTRIKEHTSNLSGGIRDLIWSLDIKKDSLFQTLLRLQEFGDQLFEFSSIDFKSEIINRKLSKIVLTAEERKHILMIFKEAMNNCFKYSSARNLYLDTHIKDRTLLIRLVDDGIGFSTSKVSNGYGLNNMKSRAKKINADLHISSKNQEGTSVILSLALKNDLQINVN